MLANRFAFVALAAACVTAAGVGGYLANRADTITTVSQAAAPAESDAAPDTLAAPAPEVAAPPATSVAAVQSPAATAPKREARRQPTSVASARPAAEQQVAPSAETSSAVSQTEASTEVDAPPATLIAAEATPASPTVQEPQLPIFRELVIPADSVVGVKLDTAISSETASVEDRVEARVVRDVQVNREAAVPAGSRLIGSVTVVERGGKFRERARLGIRFDTLVLPDHTELRITTETIYRYGDAPGNKTAAKIGGGAVAGAILGAIIGGSKGAAVGASTGAGAGTAVVMAGDRSEASFAAGSELTARILEPVTVTLEEE